MSSCKCLPINVTVQMACTLSCATGDVQKVNMEGVLIQVYS